MKRPRIFLITFALIMLCIGFLRSDAEAASERDLTFTLNSDKQGYTVSDCRDSARGTLIVPSTYMGKPVIRIGASAFDNSGVFNVIIPDSVTSIGNEAFRYCRYLSSIVIPSSVTNIGDYAFHLCGSLTEVVYCGTVDQWKSMDIGIYNVFLTNAARHYHTLDDSDSATQKAPTCMDEGIKTGFCVHCGEEVTGTIPRDDTAHIYDHECDPNCNICDSGRITSHKYRSSWSKDKTNHWYECSVCGDKKDIAVHTPSSETTASDNQTCTVCGYLIKVVSEHAHNYASTWTTDAGGHWYACSGCEIKGSYAAHAPGSAATATTDQICTVCGIVIKRATGETTNTPPAISQPTLLSTNSVSVPTLFKGDAESNPASGIFVVILITVTLLVGGATGIIIWKNKH